MRHSFEHMCKLLAARRCYESGQTVQDIAASAQVSVSAVRRWLRQGGALQYRHESSKEVTSE